MIAATRHSIKFANPAKREGYREFCRAYSEVVRSAVVFLWSGAYGEFNPSVGQLDLPKLLKYSEISVPTLGLSARALQCACNQAGGIVRAEVEKTRRRQWSAQQRGADAPDLKLTMPAVKEVTPQLNANCGDFRHSDGKFLGFLRLSSLGKAFGRLVIPVCRSRPSTKWASRCGTPASSFKLLANEIQLAWEWERKPAPKGKDVLAIDQGLKSVATCSDGQVTQSTDVHGHSLESVCQRLARRKRGSKAFRRAATHRKNFINHAINRLNFTGFREVRLEKVVNIRFGRSSSRVMSHWTNTLIRDKILRRCEELEVPVIEQPSAYRSQRCSNCGLVRKANRKGKTYACGCGYSADADLNAAMNHAQDLPPIPWSFLGKKLSLGKGFFWKPDGFTLPAGSESIVPDDLKTSFLQN